MLQEACGAQRRFKPNASRRRRRATQRNTQSNKPDAPGKGTAQRTRAIRRRGTGELPPARDPTRRSSRGASAAKVLRPKRRRRGARKRAPRRRARSRRRRELAPRRLTPGGQPGRRRRFESSPPKRLRADCCRRGKRSRPRPRRSRRARYRRNSPLRARRHAEHGGSERRRSSGATGGGLDRQPGAKRQPRQEPQTKEPAESEVKRERKAGPTPRAYGRTAAQRRTRSGPLCG